MFTSVTAVLCLAPVALAQAPAKTADPSSTGGSAGSMATVVCTSGVGERQHCPADTSAGVLLTKETGEMACLLGRSWGYDSAGVWVMDGCGGEFLVAGTPVVPVDATVAEPQVATVAASSGSAEEGEAVPAAAAEKPKEQAPHNPYYGVLDPGHGFLIGRSDLGELSLSAYAIVRYMDQMPDGQTFTDHLGNVHPVDARKDIYSHRILVWLNGWMATPKLRYMIGLLDRQHHRSGRHLRQHRLSVQQDTSTSTAGVYGNPGSRSMLGSLPYWLGNDRVMADEFFRPYFAQGMWANGEIVPGLWYSASMGNTSSTLGVTAAQIDRNFTYGGSVWWMPTTQEFGPRGGFGDWE